MSVAAETARPRIAFYAPMKSPNHQTPSGDREIARLTLRALESAGFDPIVVSELRTLDVKGNAGVQQVLVEDACSEARSIRDAYQADPPKLWFTYHCHYKAPDLLGPELSSALDIPYVISEPSISAKRRQGDWAGFARHSESAIAQADRLFWTTSRDRPALEAEGHVAKMVHLPAFADLPDAAARVASPSDDMLRLLTVAMMRPGDKVESYRRLAAALAHVGPDWQLTVIGDGAARSEVEAMFSGFGPRVSFLGQIDDSDALSEIYAKADLFVWPGVGEGVGMVYLEAQGAGLPVIAEDHPAPSELVAEICVPAGDAAAFGAAISRLARPEAHKLASQRAIAHVRSRHSLAAASRILSDTLKPLVQ